nr:MAG TPA: Complement C5-like protein [Caudoviricetes sp.]
MDCDVIPLRELDFRLRNIYICHTTKLLTINKKQGSL